MEYRRALECLLGTSATDGNLVHVLKNGDETFPAMVEAVKATTKTLDVQTFGHWSGSVGRELAEAVTQRAGDGVRVRILLDSLGRRAMERDLIDEMAAGGAHVQWFRPLTNWRVTQSTHRGHRRVLICDGEVAFSGGVGMADRWKGDARGPSEWRDTHLRVRGPAVNGLRAAFIDNWAETKQPLFDEQAEPMPVQPAVGESAVQVVRGKAETGWGDVSTLVRSLIGLSRRRLRISASYFVPDDSALESLRTAARRGVEIQLLRPGPRVDSPMSQKASRSQYGRLLDAGIGIWEFQPCMLNAKVITVDGELASIGPMNFNSRSLTLDDEVSPVLYDRRLVEILDSHFDADLERAERVEQSSLAERSRPQRATESVLGFLARRL